MTIASPALSPQWGPFKIKALGRGPEGEAPEAVGILVLGKEIFVLKITFGRRTWLEQSMY